MEIRIRKPSLLLVSCLCAALVIFPRICRPETAAPAEQKRVILGIYNSKDEPFLSDQNNPIHACAEMVLNNLGMKVVLHDIASGIPPQEKLEDVHGIFVWLEGDEVPHAYEFIEWCKRQVEQKKLLVMLGYVGELKDTVNGQVIDGSEINLLLSKIGLAFRSSWTNNPLIVQIGLTDSGMVEFERTLSCEADEYAWIKPVDPLARVYLTLRRKDLPNSKSAAVVTTPRGGCAVAPYDIFKRGPMKRWRINPFRFFEKAFGLDGKPRYDTTTLFGKRIFYSHVDGDGVANASEFSWAKIAGEVVRDKILKKYASVPVTVSFIISDVEGQGIGKERIFRLAREIFALDNVEMGSHSYTHPLDWGQKITVGVIPGYSRPILSSDKLDIASESVYGRAALATVGTETFLKKEVDYAVDYADKELAPPGKKTMVYQWTGDCRPPVRAIVLADEKGLYNINGGDSRFDKMTPTYTTVAPLTRQIEGLIQPLTSNSNENIYTRLWTGPYSGYRAVIETFKETERPTFFQAPPRRVSPINVYYHFYSGEKRQSLDALQKVYDYVLTQDVIPVFTSRYLAGVRGFHTGRIAELPDGGWEFSGYGGCQTARLDNCTKHPDLKRSQKILGFTRWNDALYVHLAEGGPATLYLSDVPPPEPYLRESSVLVSEVSISAEKVRFVADSVGGGTVTFANMAPNKDYEMRCAGEAAACRSSAEGVLSVKVPAKRGIKVEIGLKG